VKQDEEVQPPIGSYVPRKGYRFEWCGMCRGTGRYVHLMFRKEMICPLCEGKGKRYTTRSLRLRIHKHSPLCRTDAEVAMRHDHSLLFWATYEALKFISPTPPPFAFQRAGEPEKPLEIYRCLCCGGLQEQFQRPVHADNCIVRRLLAARRMAREHTEIHDFGHDIYADEFRGRNAIDLRLAIRWLETGEAATKPRKPKVDPRLAEMLGR